MPSWEEQNTDDESKCMLHSCKKKVKHLKRHLSNVHRMTYVTYLEEPNTLIQLFPWNKIFHLRNMSG